MQKKFRILICALIVISLITTTFAWVSYSKKDTNIILNSGELIYEKNADFLSKTKYYPGDSIGKVGIINKSTIDSQVRVKIEYTVGFVSPVSYVYDSTKVQPLIFEMNEHFRYNTSDKYFYYDASEIKTDATLKNFIVTKIKSGEQLDIAVIDDIILNGAVIDNTYINVGIQIKLKFEIKQTLHLEWEKCDDIDFNTGVKK